MNSEGGNTSERAHKKSTLQMFLISPDVPIVGGSEVINYGSGSKEAIAPQSLEFHSIDRSVVQT